ncbi:MAG: FHA domain-containing protein [Clostridiaceae bacterium]|nr:FHA domain-containing protein [Clostridiaceae bacterium]MBW4858591.1 FHA domain-containing protein [Clostridiaceae bacterium]MBW4868285.1 FHA domain-containing protein [Clostridiaceae bacterium]
MFNILSVVFKYVFILIIYLFMLSIIRLIYLDIKGISLNTLSKNNYLKLINQKETLPFKVKEAYSLDKDTTIGRGNQNNIIIKDPYISKKHLKIVKDEGDYYLEDLESANGTFVNGDKIMDVVKLRNGDRIRLGQVEFLFVNRK